MKYILKTMDGNRFTITDQEYQGILVGDGLLVLKSCGVTINKSRIESIFPEILAEETEKVKQQITGVLHDGTRVKKHFGQWVDASLQVPDERGNYQPVRLDPTYYPEVSTDKVFTEQEYERIKHLPREEKLALIYKEGKPKQIGKPESIKNIVWKKNLDKQSESNTKQ